MYSLIFEIIYLKGCIKTLKENTQVDRDKLAGRLNHKNIITIYDIFENNNGKTCIIMELIEGLNLWERIKKEGPIKWEKALPIILQVAEGLSFIHSQGIIHRDIKPQNILIADTGEIKITDFGIAKDIHSHSLETVNNWLDPVYASPEQKRGENVKASTDIYSLGMTYYYLFKGDVLQPGQTLKVMLPTSILPSSLVNILECMLEEDPYKRYSSGEKLKEALKSIIDEPLESPNRDRFTKVATVNSWMLGKNEDPGVPITLISSISGHIGIVYEIAFSPDGELIATCGEDGTIKIWYIYGELKLVLNGHKGAVRSVAWSKDNKWLASASSDKTVRLWNATTGEKVFSLMGHKDGVCQVSWCPDNKRLVSGSYDKTICIWDINGNLIYNFNCERAVTSVEWSPKGDAIAYGSTDGKIHLWLLGANQLKWSVKGRRGTISSISWSPDGEVIASGGRGPYIPLFYVGSGRVITQLDDPILGTNYSNPLIMSVKFCSDGELFASKSDSSVCLWLWKTKDLLAFLKKEPRVGKAFAGSGGLSFHPSNNIIAIREDIRNMLFLWRFDLKELCKLNF